MIERARTLPSRDPNRIPAVLAAVGEYWQQYPELRLGQILGNMAGVAGHRDPYYMEDDTLLERLQAELKA